MQTSLCRPPPTASHQSRDLAAAGTGLVALYELYNYPSQRLLPKVKKQKA